MAEITAGMVKALRERTDAPMMECKRALSEAQGDMGKAEELLRVRLGNKASKAASRLAAEGIVSTYVSADGKLACIVEINCETDFVAKNEDFLSFGKELAELVAKSNPEGVEALSSLPMAGTTVDEHRKALVGRIGENMNIRRFVRVGAKGQVGHYVHPGSKIGVLVDVVDGDETLRKDLAMHIAASKPVALAKEEVSAELIKKERDIATAKAAESGKPANIAEKMVEGSVQKYLKEVTLLGQPFVKDDKLTIADLLKSKGASVGSFVLYVVGEGLEKKQPDFAAEVAAQAAQAR